MNALGHKWGEWTVIKNPTSTTTGSQRHQCTVCRTTETVPIPKISTSNYASEVIKLVNAERAKNGLSALAVNSKLTEYVNSRSRQFAANGNLNYADLQNIWTTLMKSDGVTCAGENYGYGQATPEAVVTKCMNDSSCKNRILNSSYKYIGVSFYESNNRLYWVMDFAG